MQFYQPLQLIVEFGPDALNLFAMYRRELNQ